MRTEKATFFEAKVRIEKLSGEGIPTKYNELYVVNSMSFTETEAKVTETIAPYSAGEFEVMTEARAPYGEIIYSDREDERAFYRVKVDFVTADERTGKDKHTKVLYLVQGASIETAKRNVDEAMGETEDYRIVSVSETAVMDIINAETEKNKENR